MSTAVERPSALEAVRTRISERFGLVPSFFMMARAEPPIVEAMFGMVEFAYFDSPIPALFKERLFTYVSRFCSVPYCMARHCAFLVGCGNVSGDRGAAGISVDEAVALMQTPFPDAVRRDALMARLRAVPEELQGWPSQQSALSETILFAAAVVFVMPQEHRPMLAELERVLGAKQYHYLMLFLGFIRFAHFWTESHPQLKVEDDIDYLLSEQRALAEWVTSYSAQVEREVVQAKAELGELQALRAENKAKAVFISTLSHELRTPLNAVIGYTELLEAGLGGALDEQGFAYVTRIKATARHQQEIIEEILSFARLEGGKEIVRAEGISMDALGDEVRAVIQPLAEARGLAFTVDFAGAPASVESDPGKLRQILLNLVGNAVKFTTTGGVTLTAGCLSDSLVFTVSDTGPGIRAEDRERIFEPFTQLDLEKTRPNGGTGLGLAITRRLVELMRGTVRADARDGGGSSFVVALPLHPAPSP